MSLLGWGSKLFCSASFKSDMPLPGAVYRTSGTAASPLLKQNECSTRPAAYGAK